MFAGRMRGATFVAIAMLLVSSTLTGGCADHRMSVADFKAAQAQYTAAKEAEPAPPTTVINNKLGPYKLGTGDVLEIAVTGSDPTATPPIFKARVDREGNINLPLVGQVKVGGLDIVDAESTVHKAYVPNVLKDVAVHVELADQSDVNVLVFGAVTTPGLVKLKSSERDLLHAIVAAGGVSDASSGRAVLRRLRDPEAKSDLELTSPQGIRQAMALAPLEDGDVVEVPPATANRVYVGGLVNWPRPQEIAPRGEITVMQVIAAAGGLRTDVTPHDATLTRHMPDGRDLQVKLDLNKIQSGEEENLVLAEGDILWVPFTAEMRVQDFINRNFFLRAGISVNYNVSGIEFLNRQDQQSGGSGSNSLQDQFDPFGFLSRNQGISDLVNRPVGAPAD
jgi:polysaccharide export outer membrane protein